MNKVEAYVKYKNTLSKAQVNEFFEISDDDNSGDLDEDELAVFDLLAKEIKSTIRNQALAVRSKKASQKGYNAGVSAGADQANKDWIRGIGWLSAATIAVVVTVTSDSAKQWLKNLEAPQPQPSQVTAANNTPNFSFTLKPGETLSSKNLYGYSPQAVLEGCGHKNENGQTVLSANTQYTIKNGSCTK